MYKTPTQAQVKIMARMWIHGEAAWNIFDFLRDLGYSEQECHWAWNQWKHKITAGKFNSRPR